MSNINIREYEESDNSLVQSFIEKLQEFVVSTDPIKRIRSMTGLSDLNFKNTLERLHDNQGKIYFAISGEKAVGYVMGFVHSKQSDEKLLEVIPSQVGQIEDLYVEPDYRGRGIGKELMIKMENYLKEKGCDVVWLEVFAPNVDAHASYLKMGYVDREIGMLKKID